MFSNDMLRSYDSQDDAQNPFPDYKTPPGKKCFKESKLARIRSEAIPAAH